MPTIEEKLTKEKNHVEKRMSHLHCKLLDSEREYLIGQEYLDACYKDEFLKSNTIGDSLICAVLFIAFSACGIVLFSETGILSIIVALLADFLVGLKEKKVIDKYNKNKNNIKYAWQRLNDEQKRVLIEDQSLTHDLELRTLHNINNYSDKIDKYDEYLESLEEVLASEHPLEAMEPYLDEYPIFRQILKEEWDEYISSFSIKDIKDFHLSDCDINPEQLKSSISAYLGDTNILEKKLESKK